MVRKTEKSVIITANLKYKTDKKINKIDLFKAYDRSVKFYCVYVLQHIYAVITEFMYYIYTATMHKQQCIIALTYLV